MTDLKACVERGISFLDKNYPGWLHRIDLHRLDIVSQTHCIVAQTCNKRFSSAIGETPFHPISLDQHGFHVDPSVMFSQLNDVYSELTDIWRRRIRELLAVASAS